MNLFILNISNLNIESYDLKNDIKNKINKFIFKINKQQCLGSYLIKLELLKFLNIKESSVILMKEEHGKPYYLNKCNNSIIKFNISHDHDFVVLFYNDNCDVGVDIMNYNIKHKHSLIKNLRKTLSFDDDIFIKNNSIINFIKIWSFKEAYYKYTGQGILTKDLSKLTYSHNKIIDYKICNLVSYTNYLSDINIKITNYFLYNSIHFIELELEENYLITVCFDNFISESKRTSLVRLDELNINLII